MKKLLAGCVVLASIASVPVNAADLPTRMPTKAPVIAPAVSAWSCYVGVNGGAGWSRSEWSDRFASPTDVGSDTSTGGTVGGQIGCDYQAGSWVFGAQVMGNWANIDGNHPYRPDPRYSDNTEVTAIGTLTGRIGYAFGPTTLGYVKGGGAWARTEFTENCAPAVDTCPGRDKADRTGWTVGAGLEYMIMPNWSFFAEYNYMDFGRKTHSLVYTDNTTYTYGIKQEVQTVLVGVNYRLGGGR